MCIRDRMYWVTQEIFTAGDLRKFQQAVQSYDGDIKKFYVTPRDLSPVSYTHLDVYKRQGKTYQVENTEGKGFANEPMRGNLKIVKTSSDGKVEGFAFRLSVIHI